MAKNTHAKTIASIKRARTKRLASLATRAYVLHRRKQDEKLYSLICEEFVSLGGVYIKFLQGVLLRSQVMRKWHNPDKLKIFENLDSEPIDIAALLRHELPADKLSQITSIQPQPFAAGSFGQVYYGQLQNGQAIIVKVLRPMVRELLRHDLRLLNRFSKTFFSNTSKNVSFQLTEALEDFSKATLRETDYKQEAEFAHELYEHYKDHPKLIIPQTYTDLCTDNIIVQDFIDGISVAQVVKMHEQGVDPYDYVKEITGSDIKKQLQVLGYESIIGIFDMPRIQGDPHPGNVRLMRDDKVGLIDFGISAKTPDDKASLFALIEAYDKIFKGSQNITSLFEKVLKFFVSDLYYALKRVGDYVGKQADRDYVNEISQVAGDLFEKVTGTKMVEADFENDAGIMNGMTSAMNKGNRFGLVVKLESSEILRAIQTFSALIGSLGLYKDVMVPALDKAVKEIELRHPNVSDQPDQSVPLADALETISNWLERVAARDPMLFKQLSDKIKAGNLPILKADQPEGEAHV